MQVALATLSTANWEDSPKDKNRTMANMQMAAIHYVDERMRFMNHWPIYVEDENNPDSMVGIELVFDICVSYTDSKVIRYIGTIDGLVYHIKHKTYALDENKTANRLGDSWRLMFDMAHQVTGYCAASGPTFGFPVMRNRVIGVQIPPNSADPTYQCEPLVRDEEKIAVWARWLRHTVEMYETYKDDYESAPRYTHSCNRYFRPCALLTFCCDSIEGRREQWDEMVPADKSPSERSITEV